MPVRVTIESGGNVLIPLYQDWLWFMKAEKGNVVSQYYLFKNKLPIALKDDKEYILLEFHGDLNSKQKDAVIEDMKLYMHKLREKHSRREL